MSNALLKPPYMYNEGNYITSHVKQECLEIDYLQRGTLGDSEHRTTAKIFGKYRNIAIKEIGKDRNTSIGRVEIRCHNETSTLFVKFRAHKTRKYQLGICNFQMNLDE